jgi:alkylation response protein AidB-like acyl-CoA dehydrogenase
MSSQPHLVEDEALILASLDRFIERMVKPAAKELDATETYPAPIIEEMKRLGLFGTVISAEYGGLGLSYTTHAKIVERIAYTWPALISYMNSHLVMAMAVQRFGTSEQKSKWLPLFATGEMRGGVGLTEPSGGTDLQAIKTRAVRSGEFYVLNGRKTWITNGVHGHCFAVLARTSTDKELRHKALSLFLVIKGEGFSSSKRLKKLGFKGVDAAELMFEDCAIPADHLIGGEEGRGFSQIMTSLELGRINAAACGVGISQAALDAAVTYSQERTSFGKPICEHQAIQLRLADMAIRARAARLLCYDAAATYDNGERSDLDAGIAKFFAGEAALQNATDAMRVFGGYGYSPEFPIERMYRDAPLLTLGEGTNDLQRIIIARQLIERSRSRLG